MKNILLALIAITFLFTGVDAQQKKATISFDKTTHNFGKFKEEAGSTEYKFEFTNTGGEPLIINKVKASCGCTTPAWSREPVAPGARGYVSAKYNPKNRPGNFSKSITVWSNGEPGTMVLRIKGEVISRPRGIEDDYPTPVGDLRLKSTHIALGKVENSGIIVDTVEVVNMSEAPLAISFNTIPAHITVKADPATLKGKAKGKIIVTYDGKVKNAWGFVTDKVALTVKGTKEKKSRLSISATIIEDFSQLTPKQLAKAPISKFDSKIFEFGTINEGQSVSHNFKLTNGGKTDLIIRKVKSSCGCTAVNIRAGDVIKAGETRVLKTTFNSTKKRGRQNKIITVITNDPKNSTITLRVKGEVLN